jgi:hypothetical protein
MAGRRDYRHCRICRRHYSECGSISARGKCEECATARVVMNILELHEHRGPFFEHWRQRCLQAFGVQLLDSEQLSE